MWNLKCSKLTLGEMIHKTGRKYVIMQKKTSNTTGTVPAERTASRGWTKSYCTGESQS